MPTCCLPVVASADTSRASGRNMEQFTIHMTIGAHSKATFQLTYEEVLKRRLTQYDIVIKVKPKQLVQHFEVVCMSLGRTYLSPGLKTQGLSLTPQGGLLWVFYGQEAP